LSELRLSLARTSSWKVTTKDNRLHRVVDFLGRLLDASVQILVVVLVSDKLAQVATIVAVVADKLLVVRLHIVAGSFQVIVG